ncbi:hypothetical protein [Streptomyces sp. NPDC007905]|uniref:hypothetical protein n=1 Tax=Streptomyces sp. NPDC007905 TaxID=3364788 RepID=UPI0036E370D9
MTPAAERKAPVRPPHPLRAEHLRGFAPFAGVAVLLTLGVMLAGSSSRWQGGWAETATEVHTVLLITVPLAAAAGCWQGGRERRRGTEELWGTAVRPPLARFLASAVPVALWVTAGYLVGVALAMLATWPYSQGDRPHLALLPEDTVSLAAAVLAGHVVGRVVPTRPAAPLLAMAGYVGLGVAMAGYSGPGLHLNPAFRVLDDRQPVWWQPLAMAVWTGGLALAAVLAYAARRRVAALLPLAAAVAAGTLLVQTGDGLWHPDPLARRQVCDTSPTPAICVDARYAGLLPHLEDTLSGITGKLKGVRNLPVRWEDRTHESHDAEAQLPTLRPFGWSVVRGRLTDPEQYAWEAAVALERRPECLHPTQRMIRADDAVENYLAPSPVTDAADRSDARGTAKQRAELRARRAARARLRAMGDEERREWLSAYFATAGTCDVEGVPAL